MEEEQVIPAPEPKESPKKNFLLPTILIIILIILAGGAFIYFDSKKKAQPSPSASPTPTVEAVQTEASSSGTSTQTPTPTKTPTPTLTPTPTSTPVAQTIVISADASLDGFRSSNGGGNNGVDIRAGRNTYLVARGFVSFALSSVPSGANIEKATLRLYQKKIDGDPYGVGGGSLKADHVSYSALDNLAYGASALSSSFGTLTTNATTEWKDLDVTDMLKDDISNSRSKTQYRLHFAVESTGGGTSGDFAYFESAENYFGTGNTPQLVVKYH